jgi:hypothetical protein
MRNPASMKRDGYFLEENNNFDDPADDDDAKQYPKPDFWLFDFCAAAGANGNSFFNLFATIRAGQQFTHIDSSNQVQRADFISIFMVLRWTDAVNPELTSLVI